MHRHLLGCLLLLAAWLPAADVSFIAASGEWDKPSNWSGGSIPAVGDAVTIPAGRTVNLGVDSTALLSLAVAGGLTVPSGRTLTAASIAITGSLTVSGGTLRSAVITGPLTLGNGSTLDNVTLNTDQMIGASSSTTVSLTNTVTLANGVTLNLGGSSATGSLLFKGGANNAAKLQAIGSATVKLGSYGLNYLYDGSANTQMAIGVGVTVRGGSGQIYASYSGSTLAIAGTIEATTSGKTMTVGYDNVGYGWSSSGTLRASGGTLRLVGTWSNSGTLALSSGTLSLDGAFARTSVDNARWNRTGGSVDVAGVLTIGTGSTLDLTSGMGAWNLRGGTLRGGTLTSSGGSLLLTNTTGTLDGITLDLDVDGATSSYSYATITNTVTLGANRTLSLGSASTYGYLYFKGGVGNIAALNATGTATVQLGGYSTSYLIDNGANTQMSIGAGVTVRGGAGQIYASYSGSTLVIAGTIEATTSGKTMTVGYDNVGYEWSSSGTLRASGGMLRLVGTWSNSGTLALSSGTLSLDGAFARTSVGNARWNRTGGSVDVAGVLTIGTGSTFDLTSGMGAWNLRGGTLQGGTLTSSGGSLLLTSTNGTFDGITLDLDVDGATSSYSYATITNTVTLGANRTLNLGSASTYGYLYFRGGAGNVAALNATSTATVQLGSYSTSYLVDNAANTQMSIGAGVTVRGGSGQIYASYTGSTLAIAGTIEATTSGKTMTVGYDNAGYGWSSSGTLRASGGTLRLVGTWSNSGTLALSSGTLSLDGAFARTSVDNARWNRTGGSVDVAGVLTIGTGSTLDLTSGMGAWNLRGGTLRGGTLTSSGGSLLLTNTTGTLDGITLDLDVDGATSSYSYATITNTVTLGANRTLSLGSASTYGYLYFKGGVGNIAALNATGTATVQLGGYSTSYLIDNGANTQMSIGAGVTVRGGAGQIYASYAGSTLAIAGTIEATTSGKTMTVGYDNVGYGWSSSGTLRASGGTLRLVGTWSNSGTLALSSGTMSLDGVFARTSVDHARWNRTGGSVDVAGELRIGTGSTLDLTSGMGAWNLRGGTLQGGTLTSSGGSLLLTNTNGTFDGITLDLDVDGATSSYSYATITNTVTLGANRTLSLGSASTYGYLYFKGGVGNIAALNATGTATVQLGGYSTSYLVDNGANTQMSIGAGVTVRGGSGQIYASYAGSTLAIAGTIEATTSGKTMTVGYDNVGYGWSSSGTLRASGGTLRLVGTWSNSGTLALSSGTMSLDGVFARTSVDHARWNRTGGSVDVAGELRIGTGSTLDLTSGMGAWNLRGGTLQGGTLTSSGGSLLLTNTNGTFDGITLDLDVDGATSSYSYATITNTVTLSANRTLSLGSASTYGYLYFKGGVGNIAALNATGTATVQLGGYSTSYLVDNGANTQMSIGAGVTVRGGAGQIYASYSGSTLVIAGTIEAGTAGKSVQVGTGSRAALNQGTIRSTAGSLLLRGALTNAGILEPGAGSAATMSGLDAYTQTAAGELRMEVGGTTASQFDRLLCSGALTLDGTLRLAVLAGYRPLTGTSYVIVSGGSRTGSFANVVGSAASSFTLANTATGVQLDGALPAVSNVAPVITEGVSVAVSCDEDNAPTAFALTLHATDADADPLTWGIATLPAKGSLTLTGAGTGVQNVSYLPNSDVNGSDAFVIQVGDGKGGTASCTVAVTVAARNDPPENTAIPTISGTPAEGAQLTAQAGMWNDDRDGGSTISYAYAWFRTSDPQQGVPVTLGQTGSSFAPGPSEIGQYLRVEVTATDSGVGVPAVASASAVSAWVGPVTAQSTNTPPEFDLGPSASLAMVEDGTAVLDLVGSDPDEDPITWSILLAPAHGDASVAPGGADHRVTYQPANDFAGSDSFVVQISDGQGGTANCSVSVSVAALNDPPSNTLAPSISGSLTAGSVLTATAGEWNDSADGQTAITFSYAWFSTSDPQQGQAVALGASGTGYTPDAGQIGRYVQVRVTATDDGVGTPASASATSASAWVGPVVAGTPNQSPQFASGATASLATQEDVTAQLDLVASDPDADALTWTLAVTPVHGSASIAPGGTDHRVTYQPAADYAGADTFTVAVADGRGGVATCVVSVAMSPVNDPPVVTAAPTISGLPELGVTLIADVGGWQDSADGGGTLLSYGFDWRRATDAAGNGAIDIPGADGASYRITSADVGSWLSVRVTASDNGVGVPASATTSTSSGWVQIPTPPTATLVAGDRVVSEGAGVVAGNPAVVLTAVLSAPSPVALTIPVVLNGTADSTDLASPPGAFAFAAGATVATLSLAIALDGPDGGTVSRDETLVVGLGLADGPALSQPATVTVTIADEEPLQPSLMVGSGAPQVPGQLQPVSLALVVGEAVSVAMVNGRPPFSVASGSGVLFYSYTPVIEPGADGDADLDPLQRFVVVADRPLEGVAIEIADRAGSTVRLLVTSKAAPAVALPAPPVALSGAGATVYGGLAPGTAQGLASLRAALAGRGVDQARAFWWDALVQSYRELNIDPDAGLTPAHGIFLATRSPLALDFSGTPAGFYFPLNLPPGYSFVAIPPLSDGTAQALVHPLSSFVLFDAGGSLIVGSERQALIGSVGYEWNGSSYRAVNELRSGVACWLRNASATNQTLTLVRFPDAAAADVRSIGTHLRLASGRVAVADEQRKPLATRDPGPPPVVPGAAAPSGGLGGGGSGGCGGGAGIILLGLAFLGLWRKSER